MEVCAGGTGVYPGGAVYVWKVIFKFGGEIMQDFILREIDRLGEMLALIAKRLGLMGGGGTVDYTVADVKEELSLEGFPMDLDEILRHENPVWFLVEEMKLSDAALESFIDILFHSDLDETVKNGMLDAALAYFAGKGKA